MVNYLNRYLSKNSRLQLKKSTLYRNKRCTLENYLPARLIIQAGLRKTILILVELPG